MWPDFVGSLPVNKFHGVGPFTAAKMQSLGIETGADLKAKSLAFLRQHFGKSAAWYLSIAHGEDDRPVLTGTRRGSVVTIDQNCSLVGLRLGHRFVSQPMVRS